MKHILTITLPEGRLVVEFDEGRTVKCEEAGVMYTFVDEEAILVSDFTPRARVTAEVLRGHRKVRVGRGLSGEDVEEQLGFGGMPSRPTRCGLSEEEMEERLGFGGMPFRPT